MGISQILEREKGKGEARLIYCFWCQGQNNELVQISEKGNI